MGEQNMASRLATAVWRRRNPSIALHHPDRQVPHIDITVASVPRYALDQARLAVDRRRNGIAGRPWITAESKAILETLLRPTDVALEFGSGGSTEWLADHVAHVYSVDAFGHWQSALVERLAARGVTNVDLALASADDLGYETDAHRDAYVNAHPQLGPESVDLLFVDGEFRADTALRGIKLLRPGGVFVLDNANAYLPSPSRSPWKLRAPASESWRQVASEVAAWRHIWTSNGVWDTAIWVKPA